jgi:hypothetical protein
MSRSNHLSQKIAKDTKTNLDLKGPRLRQPLDWPNAWMVLKDGHLFVIFVTFCENAYAGWLSKRASDGIFPEQAELSLLRGIMSP